HPPRTAISTLSLHDALPIYRPRRVEPVDRESGGARDAEGRPALPLGLPGVDREHLHERGERFVEPDTVPPRHRDEVAEPHVRVLDRKSTRLNSSHVSISYAV